MTCIIIHNAGSNKPLHSTYRGNFLISKRIAVLVYSIDAQSAYTGYHAEHR